MLDSLESTQEQAERFFLSARFGETVVCARCASPNVQPVDRPSAAAWTPHAWHCSQCQGQFDVTTGTVFENSGASLAQWYGAIKLLLVDGLTADQLQHDLDMEAADADRLFSLLSDALEQEPLAEMLSRPDTIPSPGLAAPLPPAPIHAPPTALLGEPHAHVEPVSEPEPDLDEQSDQAPNPARRRPVRRVQRGRRTATLQAVPAERWADTEPQMEAPPPEPPPEEQAEPSPVEGPGPAYGLMAGAIFTLLALALLYVGFMGWYNLAGGKNVLNNFALPRSRGGQSLIVPRGSTA
ncbi:MAG TPA: hypothetical protein VGO93_07185 [Candidatus Xenobia bacterium]|jgi:hypothetical protein